MDNCIEFSKLEYQRPDFDAVQKELTSLTQRVSNAGNYVELRQAVDEKEQLINGVDFYCTLAMIRCYLDSSDAFYMQEMQYNSQHFALIDDTPFIKALLSSPFVGELENDLGEMYLKAQQDALRLTANGKELIAREQGAISRYQQLCASLKVSFNGRKLSEGEMSVYISGTDRNTRLEASIAVRQAYLKHKDEFESILDELVDIRIALAKANGFERYTDYINLEKGRRGYGQNELMAFCRQVKEEMVPLYAKLNRQQAKRLGMEKLSRHDVNLVFPDGNARPLGDGPDLMERAKGMYDRIDDEIAGLYRKMADNGYIDVTASPNKISGMGFCTALQNLKMPYIFGNCDGTVSDTLVLTHEVGHAYQVWLCMNHHPVSSYCNMPNDAVEIPSKAMEQFTAPFGELFFDDADKFRYYQVRQVVREICLFCATCEFEDWLYSTPKTTNQQRIEKYNEIVKLYSPEIDFSEMAELIDQGCELFEDKGVYMYPGYLISYSLSNVGALAFKMRSQKDFKAAWTDYKALCMAGGSLDYEKLMETAHISPAYEPGTVAWAVQYLEKELDMIQKEG